MNWVRLTLLAGVVSVAACGGTREIECEDGSYKNAVRSPRVQAPEGLNDLDRIKEMPIPAASPQAPREDDGRCLEMPPTVVGR